MDDRDWKRVMVGKLTWSFFVLQIPAIGFTKLSFVFFFRRIFLAGGSKTFNIISLSLIILLCVWMTAFFFFFVFVCGTKFFARWGSLRQFRTYCPADIPSEKGLAISDFLTDLFVLVLPIPMVLQLRLDGKRKIAVLFVFGLGFIALVASIVRLAIFIWATSNAAKETKDKSIDSDLLTTRAIYWSMLESGLALIACNLPALSGLVRSSTLKTFVRSIPSRTSLRSGKSNKSNEQHDAPKPQKNGPPRMPGESILSDVSQLGVLPSHNDSINDESYYLEDIRSKSSEGREVKDAV